MSYTDDVIQDLITTSEFVRARIEDDDKLEAVQLYTVVVFNDGSQLVLAPSEEQADYFQAAVESISEMNMNGREVH
jgi:virulence-associated protein VagC